MPNPKPSSQCNCLNIRRAAKAVTRFYDRIMEPSGVTVSQFSLLRKIEKKDRLTINELAEALRIDRTTLNRNLKPLASERLLFISPGDDLRTKELSLSSAGKKTTAAARSLWGEAQKKLRDYLGTEDVAALTKLLSRLEALDP